MSFTSWATREIDAEFAWEGKGRPQHWATPGFSLMCTAPLETAPRSRAERVHGVGSPGGLARVRTHFLLQPLLPRQVLPPALGRSE